MKNIIRIFTFMLTVSIFFTACNKDTSLTEEVKNIDPTEQKILNFKEQMKSGDKSGETMSIDSAVWYIEAALNYTYCIVPQDVVGNGLNFNTSSDSISFNINVNNGVVTLQDATNSYEQMKVEINSLLAGINYDVKFMNIIDVEYEDGEFNVIYVIKFSETANKYLYNITDSWYAGDDLGNCSGTVLGRDLTDEIERWISINRAVLGGVYYTDNEWDGIFYSYAPSELDMYSGCSWCYNIYTGYDNIGFYTSLEPIWSNGSPSNLFQECVIPSRGNYHAQETNQGLDYIQQYKMSAPGRRVNGWDVMEEATCRLHAGPNEWYAKHRMYVWSGMPHKIEENQH